VRILRSLGHDTARVDAGAWGAAADLAIVEAARREHRTVLTQDLDFSAIVALSGRAEGVQRVPALTGPPDATQFAGTPGGPCAGRAGR
jgi:Domain of unknown function (DUF5615)